MITTAVIKNIDIDSKNHANNKYLVEIPLFKRPGVSELSTYTLEANACEESSMYSPYKIGDKVYVSFINNDISLPVILGKIYQGLDENSRGYGSLESLAVKYKTVLSEDTKIGDITYTELRNRIKDIQRIKDNMDTGGGGTVDTITHADIDSIFEE